MAPTMTGKMSVVPAANETPDATADEIVADLVALLVENENAALREEIADLKDQLAAVLAANPIEAATTRIMAGNRRGLPEFVSLSAMLKLVPPGVVSSSTVRDWCNNYLGGQSGDETKRPLDMIVCRQPGGPQTPIEVDVESFWNQIESYARRKRRPFTRPE